MNEEKLIPRPENETKLPEIDIIRSKPEVDLPAGVEKWMVRVEKTQTQTTTILDDSSGQPLMSPSAPSDPQIVLPITRKTFADGFKKTVGEAGKWLSEYIFRLIKIKKGKIKFKEE
ncbi:MAG: hypothetical protein Q8P53_03770 [Candidatus Shapirobacteria bacterium]|nr:hypothetical protein [Candidatus Shapirobacteria bacterium]